MTCEIEISSDRRYVILKTTQDISRHTFMEHVVKAHQLGAESDIDCFLLDLTGARNIDAPSDQYEFVHSDVLNSDALLKCVKIAVIVSPDDHSHDFIETVIRNAGFMFKLFRDREAALRFLNQ